MGLCYSGGRQSENQRKQKKKKEKYYDLAWKTKMLWNTKLMMIPITIGELGTALKSKVNALEELEIGGRIETIQTTESLCYVKD